MHPCNRLIACCWMQPHHWCLIIMSGCVIELVFDSSIFISVYLIHDLHEEWYQYLSTGSNS